MLVTQLYLALCNPVDCSLLQATLSMGFSRQEYCRGLLFPSPGYLPDPGIEPGSPALQADSLPAELPGKRPYVTVAHFMTEGWCSQPTWR